MLNHPVPDPDPDPDPDPLSEPLEPFITLQPHG